MLTNDIQLLTGLLAGLPKCATCHLPATRRAILEWANSINGEKTSYSWLVCDHANHEASLGGDSPTRLEPLEAATCIHHAMHLVGSDSYLTHLINREMNRLRFKTVAIPANPGLVTICQDKRELLQADPSRVLATLLSLKDTRPASLKSFLDSFQAPD